MISLAPYLTAGWGETTPFDYYLHEGRLYVTGSIENATPASLTSTILTGLPVELCPRVPTTIILPILWNTTDVCDAAFNLPLLWETVVHPAGDWVILTALPASLKEAVSEAERHYDESVGEGWVRHPQYTNPFRLVLGTGNASWPIAPLPDSPSFASLGGYVGGSFTDGAAEYAVHNTRVHLGGKVTANEDEAEAVLSTMPPKTTDALPGGSDITTAALAGDPLALEVFTDELFLRGDSPIVPTGDTPPLGYFNRLLRGAGPKAGLGEQVFEHTYVGPESECALPSCKPEFIVCGVAEREPVGTTFDIHTLLAMCVPTPDFYLIKFAARVQLGVDTRTSNGARANFLGFFGEECPKIFITCPEGEGFITKKVDDGCPKPEGACSVNFTEIPAVYTGAGVLLPPTLTETEAFQVEGYLKPPASLYKGTTSLPSGYFFTGAMPALLWTPAQATTIPAFARAEGMHEIDVDAAISIVPLYKRRQLGLHAGDVLDLTDTGWETTGGGLVVGQSRHGVIR